MTYPKPMMSITELVKLGFSRDELSRDVHVKGQNFAIKTPGGGKWRIDTEEYEKFRRKRAC